jgi:site-specific DNA-methyltransferase (adenine-specific)
MHNTPSPTGALRGTPPTEGVVMDSALARVQATAAGLRTWYVLDHDRLSLRFDPRTPYEAWIAETTGLLEVARGIQWLVGDALAFGEMMYGERAAQVYDSDRYSFETVTRMARTARAIEPGRRRPNVPFAIHADVAALPLPEQEALLNLASDQGLRRDEIRILVRQTRQRLERERAAALPAPRLTVEGITLEVADAQDLPLPDACVDLIVTSPPYALDQPYGQAAPDITVEAWPGFMRTWLQEAYRVTKPSGRLALNVALDTSEPHCRPTYAQAVAAALGAGWAYRFTIAWVDNGTTKGNRALGSINSASRPHHISQMELILVCCKGDWSPSSLGSDDITGDDWQAAGRGPWLFPGETRPWEAHPAPFPLELPRRLIHYLSRVGDVILDPFVGSGSTAIAAYQAGRICYGYDLDRACIDSATRRLTATSKG